MGKLKRLAPTVNGYVTRFAPDLLGSLRSSYESFVAPAILDAEEGELLDAGSQIRQVLSGSAGAYYMVSFGKYPLGWISANSVETYDLFRGLFDAIAIEGELKDLVDHHFGLVMYSGFFVVGRYAPATKWHVDYLPGSNAFTLITPLYEWNPAHGNLFYMDRGWPRLYNYKCGEAIVFGDGFLHSTQPYACVGEERVLVSLTLGTDKMQYWESLSKTVGSQSRFLRMPSGEWLERAD